MVSVVMPEQAVRDLLTRWDGRLSVAAVNSPAATVVSGDPEALAEFGAELSARRVLRWPVPASDFVAHSPRIDELAQALTADLAGIQPAAGEIPLFSTVRSAWADGPELGAGYWYDNVRQTVRFAESVRVLVGEGYRVFVEVSPHAVLTAAVTETAGDAGADDVVTAGTLDREDAGARRMLAALARVHVRGVTVDWAAVLGGGHRIGLPTYAFQHQLFWPEPPAAGDGAGHPAGDHAGHHAGDHAGNGTVAAGGDGAGTAAEARFWAAVEGGDLRALAEALAVEDRERLTEVLPALAAWRRRERDRSATERLWYRVSWAPVTTPDAAVLPGMWLVVIPAGRAGELARWCVRALAARGGRVIVLEVDPGETDRRVLAAALSGVASLSETPDVPGVSGVSGVAGVVSLLALDEAPVPAYPVVPAGLAGTVTLVQGLGDAGIGAPLWVLTSGAVAAADGEAVARPVQAMAWGLGRVAGLELPERWGGLIDLPAAPDGRAAGWLGGVLAGCGEDQVAIRDAGVLGRRLVRAAAPPAGPAWAPGGTVLVTGGTGSLGSRASWWLACRGTPRVVAASRTGPAAPGVAVMAAVVADTGAEVVVAGCDMTDRAEMAGLLARIAVAGPPLAAVVHAAGTGRNAAVAETSVAELAVVMAGKVAGAAHLDELTADLDLERFVLYSSAAGTWGSGGEGGYAAANEYLNGLASARRGRGLPATSIGWGPWSGGGLITPGSEEVLLRRGLPLLNPGPAMAAFGQLLDAGESLLTVADVDWARFARTFTLRRRSPLIESLPEVRQALAEVAAEAATGTAASAGGSAAERAQTERAQTELSQRLAGLSARRAGPGAGEPGAVRSRRRARARLARGGGGGPGLQRDGVRLADRGRAAGPAEHRDRAAPAGHAAVRLPHPGRGGGVPAPPADGPVDGRADGRAHRPPGRPGRRSRGGRGRR